jgi:anti-sigma-K factor RskA
MIPERMEENAALYVLGALGADEIRAFEAELARNPELQRLVTQLRDTTGALAGAVPALNPPPALKARILARIAPEQKIVALPAPVAGKRMWIPWALAACLAILCGILGRQTGTLREQLTEQSQRMGELNRLADGLRAETNHLQQAVAALQETNRLAGLRIAMLSSLLADSPKAVAVSLWDNEKQNGVFVVRNLKPLPADKDYQLWIIDPKYKTPVDAGVFQVDANGNVRLEFKAHLPIETPNQFAVTEEQKGGVPVPTLTSMVLAGG